MSENNAIQEFPSSKLIFGDNELNEQKNTIHIRVQQRTARNHLTTIQGLTANSDIKSILKSLKKKFATNGTIVKKDDESVIQLQGNIGHDVKDFLVELNVCEKDDIRVHGL